MDTFRHCQSCQRLDRITDDENKHVFENDDGGIYERCDRTKSTLQKSSSNDNTQLWSKLKQKFQVFQKQSADYEDLTSLTSGQRKMVVKTWRQVTNKRMIGEHVYIQIFMHKPVLKSLFPFRTIPVKDLKRNPQFCRQAAIFADFIDSVVYYLSISNDKMITDLCNRVGISHAMMTTVNFDPEWWKLFADSVLDCMEPFFRSKGNFCSPCKGRALVKHRFAWKVLMFSVVKIMSEGFAKQRQFDENAKKEPCNEMHNDEESSSDVVEVKL